MAGIEPASLAWKARETTRFGCKLRDLTTYNNARQRTTTYKNGYKLVTLFCDTLCQPRLLIIVIFLGFLSPDFASATLAWAIPFLVYKYFSALVNKKWLEELVFFYRLQINDLPFLKSAIDKFNLNFLIDKKQNDWDYN